MLRPAASLATAAGLAALAAARAAYRRARPGAGALWVLGAPLAVLAGEVGAVAFEGQSGRILWLDAWVGAGAAAWLVRRRLRVSAPRAAFLAALVPLLAWAGAGLPFARDPLTALAEWKEWAVAGVAAFVALDVVRDVPRARALLVAIAAVGAFVSLHMTWVALHDPLGPVLAVLLKRVDVPWGRTNYLAGLLVLSLPIALGALAGTRGAARRLALLAVLLANAYGLALSGSKGAVVALAAGLPVAFFGPWAGRAARGARLALFAIAGGFGVLLLAGPLRAALDYRLQPSALAYSSGERVALYELALRLAASHPVFGIGLNNFSVASHTLRGVDTVPHNFALGFAAELGLPGLALALAWAAATLALAFRAARDSAAGPDRLFALGGLAAVAGAAVHNQVESTIYGEQFKLLLLLACVALARLAQSPEAPGRGGGIHPA